LAEKIIRANNVTGLFFVFNSDVICEYPLDKLIAFHQAHGKQGTIVVTQVEDPSKYGVVIAQPNGEIDKFVEKPTTFVSDKINAGLYLFHTDMIDRIPLRPCSIEREIFP
jgi:mannose-1-phosphate guanylyltransferase